MTTLPSNRRILWLLIGASIFVAAVPYLIGLAMTPSGYRLFGNSPFAPGDTAVYYSYIEQGRQGHMMMADVFTGESYAATIWQPLWFIVGQLANVLHLSTPWMYALARIATTPLLIWAIWWLTGWLWSETKRRVVGTSLAIAAGGLGGVLAIVAPHVVDRSGLPPIDQWVSEGFVNLTTMGSPHFILVTSGIILALVSLERSWAEQSWRRMRWAALAASGVISIHPFHVITWIVIAATMIIVHGLSQRRVPWGYIGRWLALAAATGPILLLYALQLRFDPLALGRATQNILTSPSIVWTVLGLGLLFPLGLWGGWRLVGRDRRWSWVFVWAMATLVAMYLPLPFQRRLSQGLAIPWALLSVEPLLLLWATMKSWTSPVRWATVTGLAVVLGSSLVMAIAQFPRGYLQHIHGQPGHIYFLSSDIRAAADFFRWSTRPDQPILASLHDSNIIAGLTAHKVFLGQSVETLDYTIKSKGVTRLYGSSSTTERLRWLQQYGVCYIFDGPQERIIGPTFRPEELPGVHPVWTSPTVTIYTTSVCST